MPAEQELLKEVLDRLTPEAHRVRNEAFRAIARGEPAGLEELAERTGMERESVEEAVRLLVSCGTAEKDDDGLVVGAWGLTTLPTRHSLELAGVRLYTWCAIDALGIPPALGADAIARSRCENCGRLVEVEFRAGIRHSDAEAVAWLPTAPCANAREEFCPHANAFCSPAHAESWRAGAGEPPGRVLTLDEIDALGRANWSAWSHSSGSGTRRNMPYRARS